MNDSRVLFGSECCSLYQGVCAIMGRAPGLLNKLLTAVGIGVGVVVWGFCIVEVFLFVGLQE